MKYSCPNCKKDFEVTGVEMALAHIEACVAQGVEVEGKVNEDSRIETEIVLRNEFLTGQRVICNVRMNK